MHFNPLLDKFIRLLPSSISNNIRASISKKNRHVILKKWDKMGRPVPPPHELKQTVIEFYQQKYKCNVLVETGTYMGDMVEAQRENFDKIYSIELSEKLWKKAVKRFEKYPHIKIKQGDSGLMLNEITSELIEPAIFWLDGHYSAGITARGEKDCPIFGEIDAVFKNQKQFNHILLVDDARCFVGEGDYPTIEELTNYIKNYNNNYTVEVKDDLIRYTV